MLPHAVDPNLFDNLDAADILKSHTDPFRMGTSW